MADDWRLGDPFADPEDPQAAAREQRRKEREALRSEREEKRRAREDKPGEVEYSIATAPYILEARNQLVTLLQTDFNVSSIEDTALTGMQYFAFEDASLGGFIEGDFDESPTPGLILIVEADDIRDIRFEYHVDLSKNATDLDAVMLAPELSKQIGLVASAKNELVGYFSGIGQTVDVEDIEFISILERV